MLLHLLPYTILYFYPSGEQRLFCICVISVGFSPERFRSGAGYKGRDHWQYFYRRLLLRIYAGYGNYRRRTGHLCGFCDLSADHVHTFSFEKVYAPAGRTQAGAFLMESHRSFYYPQLCDILPISAAECIFDILFPVDLKAGSFLYYLNCPRSGHQRQPDPSAAPNRPGIQPVVCHDDHGNAGSGSLLSGRYSRQTGSCDKSYFRYILRLKKLQYKNLHIKC